MKIIFMFFHYLFDKCIYILKYVFINSFVCYMINY
jgi:hypothetical protein